MRIALHLATLRGLGSAAVGRNVLAELARGPDELAAWIPREWPGVDVPLADRVRRVPAGSAAKFIAENGALRRALRRWPADRLFSLGDTSLPRCPVPHLLLVQQAFLAYPPGQWGFMPPARIRAKMALMAAYFRMGIGSVTKFTVQTHDMKARLSERWRIRPERIEVVPSAVDGDEWDRLAAAEPSERPPGEWRYACCVTGSGPHKNVGMVPRLLAALPPRHRDVRIAVTVHARAVPLVVEEARRLRVADRVEFLGSIGRDALPALLGGAVASLVPSRLESFGLTYYESLAAGTPVVASDRGFAREALGDVGLFAAPDSAEAWAAQLTRLLDSESERLDRARRSRARFRAVRVRWPDIVARYRRILEEL